MIPPRWGLVLRGRGGYRYGVPAGLARRSAGTESRKGFATRIKDHPGADQILRTCELNEPAASGQSVTG
jgi:hypothetical protein